MRLAKWKKHTKELMKWVSWMTQLNMKLMYLYLKIKKLLIAAKKRFLMSMHQLRN